VTKEELVQIVQDLAKELGHVPKFREFESRVVGGQNKIRKLFGTFSALIKESGLEKPVLRAPVGLKQNELTEKNETKLVKQYQKICGKREQIQGFFRTTLDLAELFARAGNPSVLKMSAMPDTHVKFMDKPAVNCYLKFLEYQKPHVHLIMGDFADCEGLSHWPDESLEPRRIVPEMKLARELLQRLVDATPGCSARIFLEGNHENWIIQALGKMPELFDGLAELDIEISLKTLMGLDKFGYTLFPMNELVQIGKAHFTHGIYCGTHHAKKHLDVFKSSIFYGHLHDRQTHNQTSMDGPMVAASLACLARLDAKFLKGKPNNWENGFGIFEFLPDGSFNFSVPSIVNGRMSYNGILFDGNI
jgi:hypothetical protein